MYPGNKGNADQQCFATEKGAKALSEAEHVFIDVSYKCTPRISPVSEHPYPYGGALHFIAGHELPDRTFVPARQNAATVLMRRPKPNAEEYFTAMDSLDELILETYNIKMVSPTAVIILMGDMEDPLFIAAMRKFINHLRKICFFHYAQALEKQTGKKGLAPWCRKKGSHYSPEIYKNKRNFTVLPLLPPTLGTLSLYLIVSF